MLDVLRKERKIQLAAKLKAGEAWNECDLPGLVFTNEIGGHIPHKTAYKQFKRFAKQADIPAVRFHDMRHTYATLSLQNGDDIKTISSNLGHATVAFTLDTYGHVTKQMNNISAQRMEAFIQGIK